MPSGRKYRPRKNNRRRRYYKKKNTLATTNYKTVPMPKVYGFHRSKEELLALEDPDAGATGWISTFDDAVCKTFVFSLNEFPNFSEFTNLYAQYKLNACALKIYPSYSEVVSSTGAVASTNLIITVWPNVTGTPLTAAFTKASLNEIQRKRQWMFPMNKPTSIYMKLKQLNEIYQSTLNTDYTVMRPRYISTTETSAPHYGLNVHIAKVDGSTFGSNSARLKIFEKVFLTCKQVR